MLATSILDRLLHRCHSLNITGRSYRLRELEGGRGRKPHDESRTGSTPDVNHALRRARLRHPHSELADAGAHGY